MSEMGNKIYEFGDFRFDTAEQILQRAGGEIVPLTPKVFDLLQILVERHGHLLSKDELIKTLWAESFVEEANLNVTVSALRRALGEKPNENRYIETVPRRGYRFVAEVRALADESGAPVETDPAFTEAKTISLDFTTRRCPACGRRYTDKSLNFCLDDGERLEIETRQTNKSLSIRFRENSRIWLALGGVLFLMIAAGAVWKFGFSASRRPEASGVRTLAVLPFKPLAGSQRDAALEIGMADALITKLANLEQLTVRPTSAITKYAEAASAEPLAAGRELQVEAVLDGKIQRAGDKIRVTVQLLRVADGATLWTGSFDDFFTNIFAVQDSISEKMTSSLALKLSGKEREKIAKRHTENTEAYQLYLQGRYYHEQLSREGSLKAIEYYDAAIRKDPEYALAYAWMVGAYAHLVNLNIDRDESLRKARNAAEKAVALDPNLPDAHESLATIKDVFDWNWAEAEKEYLKAIELDAKNPDAHFSYSLFLSRFRRHNEAIREVETARQLNPTAMYIQNQVIMTLMRARHFDEAIAECKKAIELKPDNMQAHGQLVKAYVLKAMYPDAEKALKKYLEFDIPGRESMTAYVDLYAGRKSEAEKILRELAGKYKEGDNCTVYALYQLHLGDKDRAMEFLEKAYRRREPALTVLNVEPEWDELHADARFQDLVRRIGLPLN